MIVEGTTPDPREARSPAGFVARLRTLKDASGLTFRELADRAEAVGDVLPRSTIANMLSRATVPREELLAAFVRACGCGPAETESWLAARKEMAAHGRTGGAEGLPEGDGGEGGTGTGTGTGAGDGFVTGTDTGTGIGAGTGAGVGVAFGPGSSSGTGPGSGTGSGTGAGVAFGSGTGAGTGPEASPVPPARRRRRRTVLAVAAGLAVLAAVSVTVALLVREEETPPPLNGPAPGPVKIRAVHSGLCLAEQDNRSGRLYQVPCASAATPEFALNPMGDGVWRLETDHPDYGPGCTGIWDGGKEIGAAMQDQECGKRGAAEAFWVEPVGEPVRGYRLRPTHSGLCAGFDAIEDRGAEAVQLSCEGSNEGLLFSFDPA